MGVLYVHIVAFFGIQAHSPLDGPLSLLIGKEINGILSMKAYALMSLSFGVSFFIIMNNAAAKRIDFSARFAWRLVLLAVLGFFHSLILRDEMLIVLAALGLLLIPFYRIKRNAVVVGCAVLILLQIPLILAAISASQGVIWPGLNWDVSDQMSKVYKHGSFLNVVRINLTYGFIDKFWRILYTGRLMQVLGFFLIGMVLGRIGFFRNLERFRTTRRIGILLFVLAYAGLTYFRHKYTPPFNGAVLGLYDGITDSYIKMVMAFAIGLSFIELYYLGGYRILKFLAPVGRMSLSVYVSQSLIFVPMFYGFGFGFYDRLNEIQALGIGTIIFAATVLFANLWFQVFQYGPLEWLWRAGTYMTFEVPFLRRKDSGKLRTIPNSPPAAPASPEPKEGV